MHKLPTRRSDKMNKTRYNLDKLMKIIHQKKTELNEYGYETISGNLLFDLIKQAKED